MDNDNFTCTAENEAGKARDTIEINVLYAPVIENAKAYENDGVYVCNVSNGIPSTDDKLWQTGTIQVIIKESPVFTEQSKPEQIGYIDNTSSLFVDVMSSSKILSTTWFREGSEVAKIDRLTMTRKSQIIKASFHTKMVFTKGYRCTLTINKTKPEDFHNYTVTVQNEYGFSSFIKQLQYAGRSKYQGQIHFQI
ncbi:unnamed protein product [Mytilus edulis]|uniref:Immunoglobulin I-set domain-containing protein n=1 Tax=Mytilus edulis TaxID=6550 RepID=A0A8S3Q5C9_MYTED|nr:unnamed protein product [Mytilus edulis]